MDVSAEAALAPFTRLQLSFKTTVAVEVRGDANVSQSASLLAAAPCFSASTLASFSPPLHAKLGNLRRVVGERSRASVSNLPLWETTFAQIGCSWTSVECHMLYNNECEMLFHSETVMPNSGFMLQLLC